MRRGIAAGDRVKLLIAKPKVWKQKFAWLPTRIGPFRVWLECYEVRSVPATEAWERYPQMYYSAMPSWLDEFKYDGHSYWRCSRLVVSFTDRTWVVVKPSLKLVAT